MNPETRIRLDKLEFLLTERQRVENEIEKLLAPEIVIHNGNIETFAGDPSVFGGKMTTTKSKYD